MVDETQELILNPDTKDTKFIWLELDELKKINLYPIGISAQILDNITDTTHFIYKE
jgi:hypothetical protein